MASVREVLPLLKGVEEHDGYWTALCPGHDDRAASLSISEGRDEKILLKCHAGCTVPQICYALGKTVSWLFPDHGLSREDKKSGSYRAKQKGTLVATYDYRDPDGVLVYQSCRFERDVDGKRVKTFEQRRPDGEGGWIYKTKGTKKYPYRLPELLKVHKSEIVFVVEGEKHVDRLRDLGFAATCNVGGAGKWLMEYSQYFVGRNVVILPDNDEAGQKHAAKVYDYLKEEANSVRQVTLPNLPPKGDVIDWLASGGTADQLKALIKTQTEPVAKPEKDEPSYPDDEEIIAKLGLDVFGEDEDGRIKVFSEHHRKTMMIRDIDKLSRAKLIQICGPKIRSIIWDGKDETPDDMIRLKDAKEAIASLAGNRRLEDQAELGIGVWEGCSTGTDRDSIILVNAGEAAVLNHRPGLQKHEKPRYGEQLLNFGTSEPWFSFDVLARRIDEYTSAWASGVVEELQDIFAQWWFGERNQELMPALLSGLVLATWVQTIWRWRPQVFVLGKSNSGKTTLFEFLAGDGNTTRGLFGRLVISSIDTSAAGISQTVRHTAKAVILDEVENSRRRDGVLQMLRGSGRGGKTLRGTSHHKSVSTGLRHIVWAAATESGLKKEVDVNRFIVVNLESPPEEKMGKLKVPSEIDCQNLGQKLLSVAVKTALSARDLSERLKEQKPSGYHYRIVESYSVPAAAYAMAMGMSASDANGLLEAFLSLTDPDDIEPDDQRVLDAIIQSHINLPAGKRETIGQAVYWRDSADGGLDRRQVLESVGVVPMKNSDPREAWIDGEEECVFLMTSAIEQNVLTRHDEWRGAKLVELLRRLPRAKRCVKKVSGRQVRGVLVPLNLFVEREDF